MWTEQELRPTRDVDFLGVGPEDHATIRTALEAICEIPCPEDGAIFDGATIRIDDIRDEQRYGGVRARILGRLGQAQLHLQVDIGFGDVITPRPEEQDYPTLLDLPIPRLWTYPRETLVAEKFEAMVQLGATNSRVKDVWDLSCLSRIFDFEGETLRTAINNTFQRRRTTLTGARPLALLPDYYEAAARAERWQLLRRQIGNGADGPAQLTDAGQELQRFLGPVYDRLIEDRPFAQTWPAGGPWRPAIQAPTGAKALGEATDRMKDGQLRRFRSYTEYRDSGVEWLREIPAHWAVERLKYLATLNDDTLPESTAPSFEMTYVDIGSVDAVAGITETESVVFEKAPSRARRVVRDGDVIVSTVRTYLRVIASIEAPEPNLIVSTGFAVIRPRQLESSFASYALRAPHFVERVVANSVGVSYPAINASNLACFPIPYLVSMNSAPSPRSSTARRRRSMR